MTYDPRDEAWNAVWRSHYDIFFQEMLAERLTSKWSRTDGIAKILIAVGSSSSAIAGWALWQDASMRITWASLAGLSALFAIVQRSLDMTSRTADWETTRGQLVLLRIENESLLVRLTTDPDFDVPTTLSKLEGIRARYATTATERAVDFLNTRRLRREVQDDLDRALQKYYESEDLNGDQIATT